MTSLDLYSMLDIEETQCVSCRFRKNPDVDFDHAIEYPMCYEIEGAILAEDGPVEVIDKAHDGGVVCTKYRPGDPRDFVPDPYQLPLF